MLWAALAFGGGIAVGIHAWRPPLWWVVAWIVFALSGSYLLRRRGRSAFIVGLGALFFLGALTYGAWKERAIPVGRDLQTAQKLWSPPTSPKKASARGQSRQRPAED